MRSRLIVFRVFSAQTDPFARCAPSRLKSINPRLQLVHIMNNRLFAGFVWCEPPISVFHRYISVTVQKRATEKREIYSRANRDSNMSDCWRRVQEMGRVICDENELKTLVRNADFGKGDNSPNCK